MKAKKVAPPPAEVAERLIPLLLRKELHARAEAALEVAVKFGGIDGAHHKMWVLDQVIRYLCGAPVLEKHGKGFDGKPFVWKYAGTSPEYERLVKDCCTGSDGVYRPEYWDCGIAP